MSKPNGRRKKALEGLAAALTECFEAATESAAERAADRVKAELEPRLDRMDSRLDRQDKTLRMIWTQCGGKPDQRLPVDD